MSTLYIIPTPIGNMEDITLRVLRVLGEVHALACEDTRMTRKVLERNGIATPATVISYHEHNEERAGRQITDLLKQGLDVGLCSDGGMPGISDPGYRIVRSAAEAGVPVTVLPGPCAVPTALVASGLPTSSFTFKGFPPRTSGKRQNWFAAEYDLPHTLIFYESPYRIGKTLGDALTALGDREAAVCLELTKKFESIHRGYLSDLYDEFSNRKTKGEITCVIAGNHPKFIKETSN